MVYGKPRNTRKNLVGAFPQESRKNMAFTDQTLYCRDCNQEFVFTAGEQEFFASRGLTNSPSRCPSCRAARKGQSGDRYSGGRSGGYCEPRQMYTVSCSSFGHEAQGPFPSRGGKPVYLSNCYQSQGAGRAPDRRSSL